MAYNEHTSDRIRNILNEKSIQAVEKKMMGGMCFMVDDKMCVGVVKDEIMARVGPDYYSEALEKQGCKEMNFTGRPMKGFVFLEPEVVDLEEQLEFWIQKCLDFNPLAKSSKKRKK